MGLNLSLCRCSLATIPSALRHVRFVAFASSDHQYRRPSVVPSLRGVPETLLRRAPKCNGAFPGPDG